MGYRYVSRERVMRTPDIKASAYAAAEIDAAIESATVMVDKLCHRGAPNRGIPGFLPWTGTLAFDWPNAQDAGSFRLWLDNYGLISCSAFTTGGTSIAPASLKLYPQGGPPYSRIEIDRSTSSAFSYGNGVGQYSLSVTGTWGFTAQTYGDSRWTIGVSVGASVTALTVTAPVGVGECIMIGAERLFVTETSYIASGQTASALGSSKAEQLINVSDGTKFFPGENIIIDAERMLVRDVVANALLVERAVDGTTLAAHTLGAAVYWPRNATVERGVLGTTAAAISNGATFQRPYIPPPIQELTQAYAIDTFYQGRAAYARTVGTGESERTLGRRAIEALEERVYGAYGRRIRSRAV